MFWDYIYATDKEKRKSVRGLVNTLGETLMLCSSNTHKTVALISTEAEYVAPFKYIKELKFVCKLLEVMPEVQKPLVMYKDNIGAIFLAENRQVDMPTKHIDIRHLFLGGM